MKDYPLAITRRHIIKTIPFGIASAILLKASPAKASWFGVVFEVASFGFETVAVIAGVAALATGALIAEGLDSVFSDNSSSGYGGGGGGGGGGSSATYTTNSPDGWKKYTPVKRIIISVTFDPKEQMKGDVIRILAIENDILKDDAIILPNGGKLIIEEDGTLRFANTKFQGYAYLQNNRDLTVWTPNHKLVLTRTLREKRIHNIHKDSIEGRLALTSLLGEIKHA